MKKDFKCFTLAEVLVTLAIIGIVAACTIPTVISNYQKQQTAIKLKKNYTILSQAIQQSTIENGTPNTWDYTLSSTDFFNRYLAKYLKVSKILGVGTPDNIVGVTYKSLDGKKLSGNFTDFKNKAYTVMLNDGTLLFINEPYSDIRAIGFDINGKQGPNILGKDVFRLKVTNTSKKPYIYSPETFTRKELLSDGYMHCTQKSDYGGDACGYLIMLDGWQIKDDYPW